MNGFLITFEGIDGGGKSTVASMLEQRIEHLHRSVPDENSDLILKREFVFTAEPTDGEAGQLLRSKLRRLTKENCSGTEELEELFLFMADHADHLARTIKPALDQGKVVISDRYSDSRIAYQGVTLSSVVDHPVKWVRELHEPWSVVPNLTLLFAIDPSLALDRCRSRYALDEVRKRQNQLEKFERESFLRGVEKNFELLAKSEPDRFVIIDASHSLEKVENEALIAITEFLSTRD
ncbi:MAG: dTMP kinase [Methanotrichaceae archaeon]